MSKRKHNLIVLKKHSESPDDPWYMSLKAVNMCFNRFCIDEDAKFELSGVGYLKKFSDELTHDDEIVRKTNG